MKKIIKCGVAKTKIDKRNEKTYIKKCWNCKCKYTYQLEDMHLSYDYGMFTQCANCYAHNSIIFKRRYKGSDNK